MQETVNGAYRAVYNSPSMCALSTLNTHNCECTCDIVTGDKTYRTDGLEVKFKPETPSYRLDELIYSFDANTMKTLDILTLYLTKEKSKNNLADNESPVVLIPLAEYLSLCGKKDTKPNRDRARKVLGEAFEVLFAVRLAYKSKSKAARNRVDISGDTRICVDKGCINNNIIYFRFSPKMARYLLDSFITMFDTRIFALDERNPNAYALARKLLTHYGMDGNIKNLTGGKIKLKTALMSCPMIPSVSEVKEADRHIYRRTIAPIIDALDRIQGKTGLRYSLMRGGIGIAANEIKPDDLDSVYIVFYFEGYPDKRHIGGRISDKRKKKRQKNTGV